MRNKLTIYLLAAFFGLGLHSAFGFALLGPLTGTPGGETWEVPIIGHNLSTDVGGAHNIGEEYRRVTPVLYYAYDSGFLGYFGLAGATNGDAAFAIMNAVTNVSSYSPSLNAPGEFPSASQSYNATAQSLFLLDFKSVVLTLLVEQLGLAEPERYAWTLHDRLPGNGSPCLLTVLYTVVQRNFDILDTPLNQMQYSAYVNDILYSYFITEFCTGPDPLAFTTPFPVDFNASQIYSSVAGKEILPGGFYTGLTRDDVAGLRYLYSSNNINYEDPGSAGGRLLVTNTLPATALTTLPLSLLFQNPMTNDPATLQTNFPGISFLSVTTNLLTPVVTPSIVYFYTNLAAPFTNNSTNFPAWGAIQYGLFQTNFTLSLSDFIANTTNNPATLQSLYPDLIITSSATNTLALQLVTNVVPSYTNLFGPFTNFVTGFPTNANFPPWSPLQYGAWFTNATLSLSDFMSRVRTNDPATLVGFYPDLIIRSVTTNAHAAVVVTNLLTFYTNQVGLPYITNNLSPVGGLAPGYYFTNQPGPTIINYPQTQFVLTNYDLYQFTLDARVSDPATLVGKYPGLVIVSYYSIFTNLTTPNIITYFTNYVGQGITAPPTLVIATNGFTTTFFNQFYYEFGNVITNHVYNTAPVTVITTFITNHVGAGVSSPNYTNTTVQNFYTNRQSGDLLIIPTNWCGFQIGSILNVQPVIGVSNTVGSASATFNVTNTLLYSQTMYYTFTNRAYNVTPGICNPVLVAATNYSTNLVDVYSYSFGNVLTNHYYTNTFVRVATTNVFYSPGMGTNLTTNGIGPIAFYTNIPSGDIFIVPQAWCGYTYVPLITNLNITTNFFAAAGSTNPGPYFNRVTFSYYTNYIFSIRPGFCEPALTFVTNYTTNVAGIYQYTFGNIYTNHFYTNNPVTVITTNTYLVNGGLVGAFSNTVTTNVVQLGRPGGDIFLVPSNWCGFHFTSLFGNVTATTNTVVTISSNAVSGVPVMTQTTIGFQTNYLWAIQPGNCEAVVTSGTNYSTNLVTSYSYIYSGIITNRYNPNTLATVVTTNRYAVTNALVGVLSNQVITTVTNIGITGDFFIVPPQWCGLVFLSTNFSTTVLTTNVVTTIPPPPAPDLGQQFTQTLVSSYTNTTYTVIPQICSTVAPVPNLRRGIEHVQFIRANYDSLLGRFFQPLTNSYTMTVISNSQQFKEYYQRVITTPDILFSARDFGTTPADNVIGIGTIATRTMSYDASQNIANLKGPGTITGPSIFTFNKMGPVYLNGPFASTNAFITEFDQNQPVGLPYWSSLFQWASFDTSTNSIVLYPNGTSLANLANSLFIQIQPASDPLAPLTGKVGNAFNQVFQIVGGGQPPYQLSATNVNLSAAVPGLNCSSNSVAGSATVFGVPSVPGTFNFSIRLQDSVNRVVDYSYTIIVSP